MGMKTCTRCHATKPPEDFHFIKRSESHDTRCKQCVNAYLRERTATFPHVREWQAASAKRWQRKNPEKRLWKNKTTAQKKIAYDAVQRWRAKNADRFTSEARQSIRMKRSPQHARVWPIIVAHYGGKCLNCGTDRAVCFDHVVPLSQGGENQLANGQPLCRACNSFKGALQDSSKDYRPDRGAWIAELVRLNPCYRLQPAERQGGHRSEERRQAAEALQVAIDAETVMPG